jgi:8-oxo-dGTP pyrophosphatase MutT (NUDIX family)
MRKPLQVIILPYKKFDKTIEYCIFKRKDIGAWQAISGGVEQGEKLRQTAIREIEEETGVKLKAASLLKLESTADIPSEKIGKDIGLI